MLPPAQTEQVSSLSPHIPSLSILRASQPNQYQSVGVRLRTHLPISQVSLVGEAWQNYFRMGDNPAKSRVNAHDLYWQLKSEK